MCQVYVASHSPARAVYMEIDVMSGDRVQFMGTL